MTTHDQYHSGGVSGDRAEERDRRTAARILTAPREPPWPLSSPSARLLFRGSEHNERSRRRV